MKFAALAFFLFLFFSCSSVKNFKSEGAITTFEGDSLLFNAIEKPEIWYQAGDILTYIRELKKNEKFSVTLHHPTRFAIGQEDYIIYPGENVLIGFTNNNVVFTIKGNELRTRELLFQNAFRRIDKSLWPQFPSRTKSLPVDSILFFEQKIKAEIPSYVLQANKLLDSLSNVYQLSDSFKKLFKMQLENNEYRMLNSLYNTYSIELKTQGIYKQKQNELLPVFNNITERQKINLDASFYIESIAQNLLPKNIIRLKSNEDLLTAIDTIHNNFKGYSKDFLLTMVMYRALYSGVPVSKQALNYYYKLCVDKEYESIVRSLIKQRKTYAALSKSKKDNRLISIADNKVYTLNEVLEKHRGKLILIDLWASWCVPCLEQHPYMQTLIQKYKNQNLTTIYLSMDKEIMRWRLKSEELKLSPENSYVFENFDKQSFIEKYKIESIPRYLLIGKNGNIISADAPLPIDENLEKLIKDNL